VHQVTISDVVAGLTVRIVRLTPSPDRYRRSIVEIGPAAHKTDTGAF
jgi:hypothetical protein